MHIQEESDGNQGVQTRQSNRNTSHATYVPVHVTVKQYQLCERFPVTIILVPFACARAQHLLVESDVHLKRRWWNPTVRVLLIRALTHRFTRRVGAGCAESAWWAWSEFVVLSWCWSGTIALRWRRLKSAAWVITKNNIIMLAQSREFSYWTSVGKSHNQKKKIPNWCRIII